MKSNNTYPISFLTKDMKLNSNHILLDINEMEHVIKIYQNKVLLKFQYNFSTGNLYIMSDFDHTKKISITYCTNLRNLRKKKLKQINGNKV